MAAAMGPVEIEVGTIERIDLKAGDINTSTLSRLHDTNGQCVIVTFIPPTKEGEVPKALEYMLKVSQEHKTQEFLSEDNPKEDLMKAPSPHTAGYEWVQALTKSIDYGYQRTKQAFTPALKGQQEQLEMLVEQGIDLTWQDKNGDTVFSLAVKGNKIKEQYLKTMMRRHSANPFIVNKQGDSALSCACRSNRTELALQMLDATIRCIGAAVYSESTLQARKDAINTKGKDNHTPLSLACMHGNKALVESLLNHGANPNANWGSNKLPLYLAARKGFVEICDLLLQYGANPKIEIPWGVGPFARWYSIKSFLDNTPNNDFIKSLLDNPPTVEELRSEVKIGFSQILEDIQEPDANELALSMQDAERAEEKARKAEEELERKRQELEELRAERRGPNKNTVKQIKKGIEQQLEGEKEGDVVVCGNFGINDDDL
ncbi:ankyrin repeat domain-containing protein [Parashewanella tropica]|uniref:ankyrin repeat domain-containing protein n=1 Tax=Parashewanella tropica TaxID=2547970 RepID=UPI0010592C08|nr:ankyrin repeat domain-containing protein [Parashewanella tropica]